MPPGAVTSAERAAQVVERLRQRGSIPRVPVHDYLAATSVGVVAGTPEEPIQSRAIECGGAAIGNGSNLLADAEAKGEEVKAKYG